MLEERTRSQARIGVSLVRIASLYLVVGLVLGLAMAIARDFSLMSVHSHILLLGWATLAITGVVYLVLARCATSRLAAAHFWLHNLGLPVMMASLAAETLGVPRAEPLIGVGSLLVVAGLGLSTVNVLRNAGASDSVGA
jgi:hypothetical protein